MDTMLRNGELWELRRLKRGIEARSDKLELTAWAETEAGLAQAIDELMAHILVGV